jgi:hypothetical protein
MLVLVGAFHLAVLRDHFEYAPYLGILFGIAVAVAWAGAAGIAAGVRGAWVAGALVCVATAGGLALAVTVGLPGFSESLSAPLAVPSLVVELLYLAVYGGSALARRDPAAA